MTENEKKALQILAMVKEFNDIHRRAKYLKKEIAKLQKEVLEKR